jgi:uncharacterized membrane protein
MVNQSVINEGKLCAILSYVFIGLLWYALDHHQQKNEFTKFHAKEGLLLLLLYIALQIIATIPVVGGFIAALASLALFVLGLIGLYNAFTGRKVGVPYLTEFAQKIKM